MTGQAAQLAPALLRWWDEHGRHDLPWQLDPTPYRVWVSEIMLQQTQVATVERYFQRFMAALPTLADLAAANQDDVLHLWSGLGYYSRARNLHAAAQQVMANHGGELPADPDALLALPGIGRSTAAAILALAHDDRHAILDGNVKRVLARVFGIEGWTGTAVNLKRLWQLAEQCTPAERVANYTQAIMDLGATVCTRGRPRCDACPLAGFCAAYAVDAVARIPAPKPRKPRPRRAATLAIVIDGEGAVLLQKRPPAGIWGGLWSFPEFASAPAVDAWCKTELGAEPTQRELMPVVQHAFSHFDFEMQPVLLTVRSPAAAVMEAGEWLWYNTRAPAGIGLAAPVARLLEQLADNVGEPE